MITSELKEKITKLYPEFPIIGEPFIRNSDGRRMIVLRSRDKTHLTQYGRLLLECKLDRRLTYNETVDHIDGDFINDDLSNLQLLSRSDNSKKAAKRSKEILANCIWCNVQFSLSRYQLNKGRGRAGPFCGRSCSGKYGSSIRETSIKLERIVHEAKYFNLTIGDL